MLTIHSALNFIAGMVMFVFSGVLYQGSSGANVRAYSLYTAATASWAIATGIYVFISPAEYNLVLFALRFLYATGIPTAAAFYYFSLVHNADEQRYRALGRILLAGSAGQLVGYLFTDALILGVLFGEKIYHRFPQYNDAGFLLFNISFTIIVIAAFWNLLRKWRADQNPSTRRQTKYIFWAGIIAWWPPIIMSVLLPFLGNFDYYWIAPMTTSLWVMFTAYAIFRHQVFKLRIIGAVLLVILLMVLLFINIFIPLF